MIINQEEVDSFLINLQDQNKQLIAMGKENMLIGKGFYMFDIYVTGILNRTVNIVRGFVELMKANNFIAGAPLVRVHIDSLLRLYAPQLVDMNVDDFAMKIYQGTPVRKIKGRGNKPLTDAYLVEQIILLEEFSWVKDVYETGNSYVHFSDQTILAAMRADKERDMVVNFTVGSHDEYIPIAQKHGAAFWMNKITEGIMLLLCSWMAQKRTYPSQ